MEEMDVRLRLLSEAEKQEKRLLFNPCHEPGITHIVSLIDNDHVMRKKWLIDADKNIIVKEIVNYEENLYKHTKVLPPERPLIKTIVGEQVKKHELAVLINGAIKSTIDAHGAISHRYISSATKRIVGVIWSYLKEKRDP